MDSIQTLLDYREMSATYRGAPTMVGTPMTDEFFTNVKPTGADDVVVPIIARSNVPAQGNTRGSMPRRLSGPGLSKAQFSLFHSFNEQSLEANALRFLKSPDPAIQQLGKEVIEATVEEFGRRQKLFREAVIGSIMTFGRVNLSANGDVLRPTVHATTGVITNHADTVTAADYQVANSHRGNCGGLTSGAWDTDSTDILAELEAFADAALKAGAERPNVVYIHSLRKQKLLNNTKFKAWATLNQVTNDEVLTSGSIKNFFGWTIKFVEGYWTDKDGTQQPIIPLRNAIICPADQSWKECKEGLQDVPTKIDVVESLDAALASLKSVQGMFSFAQVRVTPLVQCSIYTGDNFGIGFRNPNSIWLPTVFAA